MRTTLFTTTWVAMVLGLAIGSAAAQGPEPRCREVRRGVYECSETQVQSEPRPTVVLGRTRDRYEAPPLERDLAREIRRSVRRSPF